MKWYQKAAAWLKLHPWFKGLLVAVEGGLVGAIASILTDLGNNQTTFCKVGLIKLGVFIMASVAVAIRNYLRESPLPNARQHERLQRKRALRSAAPERHEMQARH